MKVLGWKAKKIFDILMIRLIVLAGPSINYQLEQHAFSSSSDIMADGATAQ